MCLFFFCFFLKKQQNILLNLGQLQTQRDNLKSTECAHRLQQVLEQEGKKVFNI